MSTLSAKHVQVGDKISFRSGVWTVVNVDAFESGRREFTLRSVPAIAGVGDAKMTVPNDLRIEVVETAW